MLKFTEEQLKRQDFVDNEIYDLMIRLISTKKKIKWNIEMIADVRDPLFHDRLSEAQVELLKTFVVRDPFESPVILGIASIVEAVFTLSKNSYPVHMSQLIEYFSYHAGKYFDWKTKKAKYNATRMYSNYANDLELLAKSGDSVYLTPGEFSFTLRLQLQKSLKMIGQ